MVRPVIYLYNLNPVNYTNLNWRYDYYAMSQGLSQPEMAQTIFGLDLEGNIDKVQFTVKKYYLPDRNIAWNISSNMFGGHYIFLLNPITKDEVILKNGTTYYNNVCVKCGTKTTAFEPLPKVSYAGYENAVYVCPNCRNAVIKALPRLEYRKGMKRTMLEDRIAEILDEIGVQYEQEKPFDMKVFNKVVDFFIPCGNVIIEGNGLAHHASASPTKMESKHGREAFFVNVMKDILSAYELTRMGYYVYIITEADLIDFDKFTSTKARVTPEKLTPYKIQFLKEDIDELLSLRGCRTKSKVFKV